MQRLAFFAWLCLLPMAAFAGSISGTLVEGGGVDDMRLVVADDQGHRVEAYCLSTCGDWFAEANEDGVIHLKASYQGRRVLLQYSSEPNHDRIAGPGADDLLNFITAVRVVK